MSVNLSPVGNGVNFLGTTGLPLAGGKIYTYQAGSSTPLATYQDYNGLIPNANPIILGTDGRISGELWFSAGYNYKLVLKDSNDVLIATYDNLYGIIGTIPTAAPTLPSGVILLWSGAIGSIPSDYYLCDGTNGTPDLRDRFIIGAGNTYSVSQTGGSADAIVVSHTHTATSTVTDPGHFHNPASGTAFVVATGGIGGFSASGTAKNESQTTVATTNITVATTNQSTGSSGTNANLPPYYALAYIMKS
jgi:hypothetical protein